MSKKKTLHQICKMIASGEISKEVYDKYLSNEPIGFMTPLEMMNYLLQGEDEISNEEAINALKVEYVGEWENERKAKNLAIEVLKKAEKYKWHDLQKNPDDLPKEKERIVFVVSNDQPEKYIGKTILYSGDFDLDLRKFWNDDYEAYVTIGGYDIKDVIKWKYI